MSITITDPVECCGTVRENKQNNCTLTVTGKNSKIKTALKTKLRCRLTKARYFPVKQKYPNKPVSSDVIAVVIKCNAVSLAADRNHYVMPLVIKNCSSYFSERLKIHR